MSIHSYDNAMNKNLLDDVTVIIVTFNSEGVIRECLKSVPEIKKVIVVDNASKDSSVSTAKSAYPTVEIIKNPENIGFGRANNRALEKVKTKYALLLNPDTRLEKGAIEAMVEAAEKYENAAIIAPKLYYQDGSLQVNYKTEIFMREKQKYERAEPEGDLCCECLLGSVLLLKMPSFEGEFFDPNIFLFYEDDDICIATRKRGGALVLTPKAKVMHHMGKSTPPSNKIIYLKNWHMMWSRLYLEKKYQGSAFSLATKSLFTYLLKTLGYGLTLNPKKTVRSWARVVACGAFLVGR